MDVLWKKVKDEPVMFSFLGLTVLALGGGLRSLATGDKRSSQTMMRARVFFQLCTVCTLVGTVYWRAYTSDKVTGNRRPAGQELPAYLTDSRLADAQEIWESAAPSPSLR